jgi:nucleotide-binding universal stress UspA family protein
MRDIDPSRGVRVCGEPNPVVVGIDGSTASRHALRWAVTEAVTRTVPIRLVHVVPDVKPLNASACCTDEALRRAQDEIDCMRTGIRVDSARIPGEPGEVLVRESFDAVMICVGAPTPNPSTGRLFGPTAVALLERAHCPVAVIRTDSDGSPRKGGVVSVVLDDEPDNDAIVHMAMQEGRLRNATVRQVDRRLNSWIRRYPDVAVEIVASGTGRQYRRLHSDAVGVQLAVVGDSDADDIGKLAVPNCHPILGYPDCSVLMVRN